MNDLASKMSRRAPAKTAPATPTVARTLRDDAPDAPTKRLSAEIPADLMRRLKMRSVEEDRAIREVLIDALEDALK
ncbi:hypothetical protein Bequi_13535 [Brachybacterium sp. JHP9]|uniref:Ribbon-helix-helix protein CopG domain-containing protein n=1 Tax=Brachybacterium equifaecis TaxID=2910770 RepID=A0ABT0R376_9MICO|nr:hypothetical protein [Brachybacterium equifaecis]MCL6424387.1 hypothetical protein [Brachybacterium equifaecis]